MNYGEINVKKKQFNYYERPLKSLKIKFENKTKTELL